MKLPGGMFTSEPLDYWFGAAAAGRKPCGLHFRDLHVRAHLARGSARVAPEEQSAVPEPYARRAPSALVACATSMCDAPTHDVVSTGARL